MVANPAVRGKIRYIVVQPTPFCNINCTYCYLAGRQNSAKMSLDIISKLYQQLFECGLAAPRLVTLWHHGEPLTVPLSFYEEAFRLIKRLQPPEVQTHHRIQTNGTLLTDRWCEFLLQ